MAQLPIMSGTVKIFRLIFYFLLLVLLGEDAGLYLAGANY